MPLLLFTCPSTGGSFASGIHTDARSLACVAQLPVRLQCPHCGKMHQVTAKSGYFPEAGSDPAAGSSQVDHARDRSPAPERPTRLAG